MEVEKIDTIICKIWLTRGGGIFYRMRTVEGDT